MKADITVKTIKEMMFFDSIIRSGVLNMDIEEEFKNEKVNVTYHVEEEK